MEVLTNESGRFFVDRAGMLTGYACAPDNRGEGWTPSRPILKELHIPEGVRVLGGGMFSAITLLGELTLPSTLRQVSCSTGGAFCGSLLPSVVLPEGLERLGHYAFGGSRIGKLTLCYSLAQHPEAYRRQFKDARVEQVCVPHADSPYDTSYLSAGEIFGEQVCGMVLEAKGRLGAAELYLSTKTGKLSMGRCTRSTHGVSWLDENGGIREPREETVVYDDDRGFLAGGLWYSRWSQLELMDLRDGSFKDCYGNTVFTARERFPVFDSYDAIHENRYYRWWLFVTDGQLTRIYREDGSPKVYVTTDVAALEQPCIEALTAQGILK